MFDDAFNREEKTIFKCFQSENMENTNDCKIILKISIDNNVIIYYLNLLLSIYEKIINYKYVSSNREYSRYFNLII